jgi:hypothetical protein
MSNSQAIAAVTTTLRSLLEQGIIADVPGTIVTTRPLDIARDNTSGNQLNLFLYHNELNASWRNMNIPWKAGPGEAGRPPLPLNLYYLITAFGQNNDEMVSHRLLGRAMGVLHDQAELSAADIEAATQIELPDSDLHEQVECVRLTYQPLSVDEVSKLWSAFQTEFRLSAAYQASVVLIESTLPSPRPLPVLRRGEEDRGVNTLVGPFPTLSTILPPRPFRSARLGDLITFSGENLGGGQVTVQLANGLLPEPFILTPEPGANSNFLVVQLPDDGAAADEWVAGYYSATLLVEKSSEELERRSNVLMLPLAPTVLSIATVPDPPLSSGNVTLTVTCKPDVEPKQQVSLILGAQELAAQPHPTATDTLQFELTDAPEGEHVVRLRVDGVDSMPYVQTPSGLEFDPAQKVTIS